MDNELYFSTKSFKMSKVYLQQHLRFLYLYLFKLLVYSFSSLLISIIQSIKDELTIRSSNTPKIEFTKRLMIWQFVSNWKYLQKILTFNGEQRAKKEKSLNWIRQVFRLTPIEN